MKIKSVSLFIMITCVLCACKKNDMDEKLAEEERILADFIKTEFGIEGIDAGGRAISLGGGAYLVKTLENKEGATVEAGNYVLWNWQQTNQITKKLEYTSVISNDRYPDSYAYGGPELTVVLSSKIDEGLVKMNRGEKSEIYIPSRLLLCDFQPRIFSIEIVEVIKNLSVYQETLMNGYIRRTYERAKVDTIKNVVSTVDKSEYNVMYDIIHQGDGEEITKDMNIGTKTNISYLIRERAQSYADFDITWNTNSTGMINTLTKTNCVGEILEKMNRGGKVVVAMSSKLYWDDDDLPKNRQYQYYIPKWSVVVFTININK